MGRLKDTDSMTAVGRVRALPFAIVFGFLVFVASGLVGHLAWWQAALLGLGVFLVLLFLPERLAHGGAAAAASIYTPSGSTTPPVRQYSLAESLVARGKYDEAVEAYELLAEDYPTDPEPPLRLARVLRDKLQRFDEAATWFKRALAVSGIEPASRIAITRELIELYTHKLRNPGAALPHLVRLAEANPNHPVAEWARNEYREIKQTLYEQHAGE